MHICSIMICHSLLKWIKISQNLKSKTPTMIHVQNRMRNSPVFQKQVGKLRKFTTLQAPATHGLTCINDTNVITSMLFVGSGEQEQSEKKKSVITPNSQPNCFWFASQELKTNKYNHVIMLTNATVPAQNKKWDKLRCVARICDQCLWYPRA